MDFARAWEWHSLGASQEQLNFADRLQPYGLFAVLCDNLRGIYH